MSSGTALTSSVSASRGWDERAAWLRYALDEMSACLDHAHMAGWDDAGRHLLFAQAYARIAAVPDDRVFNIDAIGASFRTGAYAGLSVVASLLTDSHHSPDTRQRELYAELAWHARNLLADVPPFADEMLHADFQDCHRRLANVRGKESGGR